MFSLVFDTMLLSAHFKRVSVSCMRDFLVSDRYYQVLLSADVQRFSVYHIMRDFLSFLFAFLSHINCE